MEIYELIKDAILHKQQIVAIYNGCRREMCPHTLGWKGNKQQCLFYQFGGDSNSGTIIAGSDKNWRCIPLDKLEAVTVQDGEWHTASNHSRRQTCVDKVDVILQGVLLSIGNSEGAGRPWRAARHASTKYSNTGRFWARNVVTTVSILETNKLPASL